MATKKPIYTKTFRRLVEGTTINGTTLLSTDYLNHFNEIVMMMELAADMPELFAEIEDWKPKTYDEHFVDSGFSHKELAVAAYEHSPAEFREPYDETIQSIIKSTQEAIPTLRALIDAGEPERARLALIETSHALRAKI